MISLVNTDLSFHAFRHAVSHHNLHLCALPLPASKASPHEDSSYDLVRHSAYPCPEDTKREDEHHEGTNTYTHGPHTDGGENEHTATIAGLAHYRKGKQTRLAISRAEITSTA